MRSNYDIKWYQSVTICNNGQSAQHIATHHSTCDSAAGLRSCDQVFQHGINALVQGRMRPILRWFRSADCVQCKCPHFVHWTDSGHSATCRKHPRTKITRGCAPNENANWFWCGDLSTSFGSGMIATLSLRLLLLQLPLHHCQTPRDFCDSKVGTLKASLRLLAAQDAPFIEKKLVWKHVVCIYVFIYLYFYIKKKLINFQSVIMRFARKFNRVWWTIPLATISILNKPQQTASAQWVIQGMYNICNYIISIDIICT